MTWAIPYRQRLPLGIAALGFAFLGMFLIYPLFQVFSASFLDAEGTALTFSNYTKMLGRPFYRAAIANTLEIGGDANGRHDFAQVDGHRLAPGDQLDGVHFDLALQLVKSRIGTDDHLGNALVELDERID